jgi:hypothetical protein
MTSRRIKSLAEVILPTTSRIYGASVVFLSMLHHILIKTSRRVKSLAEIILAVSQQLRRFRASATTINVREKRTQFFVKCLAAIALGIMLVLGHCIHLHWAFSDSHNMM